MDEDRDSLGRFAPGYDGGHGQLPAATEFVRAAAPVRAGEPGPASGPAAGGAEAGGGCEGTGPTLTPANPADYEGLGPYFAGVEYLVRRGTQIYPDEPRPLPKRIFPKLSPRQRKVVENLVIVLKAQGWGYRQIQQATGLRAHTVKLILRGAREREELKDVLADLDLDILPMAVDNIRNAVAAGDVDLSVKVAQGRGALVTHQKSSSVTANLTKLTVEYKTVPGEEHLPEPPLLGHVVGKGLE